METKQIKLRKAKAICDQITKSLNPGKTGLITGTDDASKGSQSSEIDLEEPYRT